jgi:CheY-like chemotaxis protein
VVVQSLEQARQAVQQVVPQAVLIDTASKTLDLAALGELACLWELDVPLIACPLPGEEPLRQNLVADGYLIKPVARQSLWNLLRQFGEEMDSVLVVDDDRDFVRLMSRMLDDPVRRYQVRRAYNGQQALQMIQRRPPDLVLLDLMLPDIHGYQVIDRLRSDPASQHIPVVIVSAQDEIENVGAVSGSIQVTKAGSLRPGEVMEWIQNIVNMATGPGRTMRSGNGHGNLLTESSDKS